MGRHPDPFPSLASIQKKQDASGFLGRLIHTIVNFDGFFFNAFLAEIYSYSLLSKGSISTGNSQQFDP